MAKSKPFTNPAFSKKSTTGASIGDLGLINKSNSFTSVFDHRPLELDEQECIKQLLATGAAKKAKKDINDKDADDLINITAEIQSISRQGVVLIGERVAKARALLKSYREGTFSRWLELAFGNKKTGYNILSYYDLYKALPDPSVQKKLHKMPKSAAYILASRQVDLEKKVSVINECCDLKYKDIVRHIKYEFTILDKRTEKAKDFLCNTLEEIIHKLGDGRIKYSQEEKARLKDLYKRLGLVVKSL